MYINLLFGIIFLLALIFFIQSWRGKNQKPRDLLAQELELRQQKESAPPFSAARLHAIEKERLSIILRAAEDMNGSLEPQQRFQIALSAVQKEHGAAPSPLGAESGFELTLHLESGTLVVTERLLSVPLYDEKEALEDSLNEDERFFLQFTDKDGTKHAQEKVNSPDDCVHRMAQIVADSLAVL